MITYLGLFGALLLTGSFHKTPFQRIRNKDRQDKLFLIISCVLLSFIEGLRSLTVGTDTLGYATTFEQLDFAYDSYEVLSKWLVDFVRFFSKNATVYFIVCAFLINGLILLAIYRMSCDKKFSLFLFISLLFYFTSFNALRQAIAYALVLNAFYYVREKKFIRYGILLLIAIGFHSSALIALIYLFVPLLSRKQNIKYYEDTGINQSSFAKKAMALIVTFLLSFVVYSYFDKIISFSTSFFPQYEVYLHNAYRDLPGGIQQPIVYSAIFLCFVLLVPDNSKYKNAFLVPLGAAVVFSFAALKMAYIARFMYYFDISVIIAIPYMFKNNILDKRASIIFKILVTAVCIAFLVYGLANNYMRVSDYKFTWDV